MHWDDLRFALTVAREGSLARAARECRVDHTTVGRRIDALEESLGVRLFTRGPSGYALTAQGEELLPELKRVEDAVLGVERGAGGSAGIGGPVRITCAEPLGSRWLARHFAALSEAHPELSIELIAHNRILDLARREADVAVRLFRSRTENLVLRKVGDLGFGIYGSPAYFARIKPPRTAKDLLAHDVIGSECDTSTLSQDEEWFAKLTRGCRIRFRSNRTMAHVEAAAAGIGLALLPRFLGDADVRLQRVPWRGMVVCGIWLTVHKDLQRAARVRAVLEHVAAACAAERAMLLGSTQSGLSARRM